MARSDKERLQNNSYPIINRKVVGYVSQKPGAKLIGADDVLRVLRSLEADQLNAVRR